MILTGGGARAGYQVGGLKAIYELTLDRHLGCRDAMNRRDDIEHFFAHPF